MLETDNSIAFHGKTFRTSLRKNITDDEYKDIVKHLKSKPSWNDVHKNIKNLAKGGTSMSEVNNYFFKDLMYNVRNGQDAWSVNEAFGCKEVAEYFAAKVAVNEKVFPLKYGLSKNVESSLRLCGIRCCRKPSQFPLKACHMILDEFLPDGGVWYDPCMGWGARMTAAWQKTVNGCDITYFGTDTNKALCERLIEYVTALCPVTDKAFHFSIRHASSTDLQEDWINKVDLCFTSPPYFNFEYYEGDDTSCKEDTTYEDWKAGFLVPTIKNCYKYLKDNGVLAWNIKDIYTNKTWWPLVNDSIEIAKQCGFEYVGYRTLKNIKRAYGTRGLTKETKTKGMNPNADEKILIFKKRNP